MLNKFFNGLLACILLVLSGCSVNQSLTRETPPVGTKVTVVEFSDFNCPACAGASQIAKKIKTIPNLYFEFRHLPLAIRGHETSEAAANAYECARYQDFGEEMEDALFENQGSLNEKLFLRIPETYNFGENFDSAVFEQCITDNQFGSLVKRDMSAARSLGVNATPTFFVDGIKTPRGNLLKKIAEKFEKVK
jgi:protein-disulfide isomerase